ncbi:BCL2/adenovirus E1B 19 kDa protein-interacting protein 3-like [Liolophura sinensis]|uniref:BCL2/adenovirus E1B 19 kDa protein-interacting protein 3-like n=1 Tax=Liolophura sinensis TaxID=3198878 RepID=UPI003158CF43
MATSQKNGHSEDLNESWVELGPRETDGVTSHSVHHGNLEKLLIEAQRESRSSSQQTSTASSLRGSPKSPHSPNNELAPSDFRTIQEEPGTDWIWDWSSMPTAQPPSDWGSRFKHPKKNRLSVRNTRVMQNGVFCLENLPTLLLSHAASFFLGAAVMLVYLKKYCNWATVTPATMD